MLEVIVVLFVMAWLISPIILLVLYLQSLSARKQREQTLRRLYAEGKITVQDLYQAGIRKDVPTPSVIPPAQQIPPPVQPVIPPPMPPSSQASGQMFLPPTAPYFTPPTGAAGMTPPAQPQSIPTPVIPQTPIPSAAEADIDAPETAAAETTAAVPQATFVPPPIPQSVPAPQYAAPYPSAPVRQRTRPAAEISAISVMLGVGVVLIVIAGLLFIRSAWGTLSGFGRLAALAAGSVLFFGASALAQRVWKLKRTGMAFFTIGAAFLPISIWAAGYFDLLGAGLSGPSNAWRIALAFGAFTVVSVIAVRLYHQIGWGIGTLFGFSFTYLYVIYGAVGQVDGRFLLCTAVYALLFAYLAGLLRERLPLAVARAAEPFALGFALFTGIVHLIALSDLSYPTLAAVGALLCAVMYLSPCVTKYMKNWSAAPMACAAMLGFWKLLLPLREYSEPVSLHFTGASYFAMTCMICAITFLIMLLTNSLPDTVQKGYRLSAYIMIGLSILPQLFASRMNLIVTVTMGLLLAVTLIPALRTKGKLVCSIAAAEAWMLCFDICTLTERLYPRSNTELLFSGLTVACFAGFFAVKRLRTVTSDFLFPVTATVCACSALDYSDLPHWQTALALVILLATLLLYWAFALAHDTRKPSQYVYAVLVPLTLWAGFMAAGDAAFRDVKDELMVLLWSTASLAIGLVTYLTTTKRFHAVRRLLFGLTVVPPLFTAVFADIWFSGGWMIAHRLLCTAAALLLYVLFARRGFRGLTIASFSAALLLVLETTGSALQTYVFENSVNFTVYMVTALWIAALSVLAILISRRILLFVGNDAIADVMQLVTPLTALFLAGSLLGMPQSAWHPLYFLFTLAMCVLAWFVTKPEQIIFPAGACLALIMTLEALRSHLTWESNGYIAVLLLCFAGLTVLFPYLGIVAREDEESAQYRRRSWTLTAAGGCIPIWLAAASVGLNGVYYTSAQCRWLIFFVPVLTAGYLLHFVSFSKTEQTRHGLMTAAAAFCTVAFWMQPLISVEDTYFEGKLHLLPLLAFGLVLRKLYGEKTGSGFLFAIGVYSMLRLGSAAMATERGADLVTVLTVALVMFIASFYIKQKKWFLLGGISLLVIAVYMQMRLFSGMQWWAYLLIAGLILIVVAAANEMMKQGGESLKTKAGRLWEDWKW